MAALLEHEQIYFRAGYMHMADIGADGVLRRMPDH